MEFYPVCSTIAAGFFVALLICYRLWRRKSFAPLPNIPTVLPDSFLAGFTKFRDERVMQSTFERLGPLVQGKSYGYNILFVADPQVARVALREVKGKGFFHNANAKLNALSTFSLDTGPEWQLRRNSFRRAFSTVCLRTHTSVVSRMTQRLCSVLDKAASQTQSNIVKCDELFTQLTIGVICEVAFDMDSGAFEEGSSTLAHIDRMLKHIFKNGWIARLPLSNWLIHLPIEPFYGYQKARMEYKEFKMGIIRHMKSKYEKGELPKDSLAEALVQFSWLPGVTDHDMLSEVGVFFVAGMDTTAHTLSFTIYALAANPSVQVRAQQEVDAFLASTHDDGTLPPYLEAVLKESMRKYPTAATGSVRQVRQPEGCNLGNGLHVPQDWWVFVNIFCLHNSKEIWGSDVDKFRPERWLQMDGMRGTSEDNEGEVDPLDVCGNEEYKVGDGMGTGKNPLSSHAAYAGLGLKSDELCFCPFSYGVRNCVGMNLSLMEMRVALLALVSKYHFELADEAMQNERNMLAPVTFTMQPVNGLPIRISRRTK